MSVREATDGFALGEPVASIAPLGTGLINDTFAVDTAGDAYVVQRINDAVFTDPQSVMHNIAIVTEHLAGAIVPRLVRARDGGWSVTTTDGVWRAWHRVSGELAVEPTPARVTSAARLLRQFHAAVADLDPDQLQETLPHFHDPVRRLLQLQRAIEEDRAGRVAETRLEIDAALAEASLADDADALIARQPRAVVHNDAQLPNFVFRGDDAVCLLDLDTLMPGAQFWDAGDLVRTAATRAAEDDPDAAAHVVAPELLHAIVTGYGAPDDIVETAGILITWEQAVRFLTDWLDGDVYYRTTTVTQNLDRARGQLALLASLRGTVGA